MGVFAVMLFCISVCQEIERDMQESHLLCSITVKNDNIESNRPHLLCKVNAFVGGN